MSKTYFSRDHLTSRARFRRAVQRSGGRLWSLPLTAKEPNDEDLTIDIAWFGGPQPRRAVILSSGVHGVEAFAGSAVQLQWLSENRDRAPGNAGSFSRML